MVVASVAFGFMGVFMKVGASWFSPVELVFWRTCISMVILAITATSSGKSFRTLHWPYHLIRGLIGYGSLLMASYAIVHLPLSTAVTLTYTSPLFLALLSVWLLRERLSAFAIAALLIGFVGVMLLLKPVWSAGMLWYSLVGLGSGLLAGWSYLHVRELGKKGEQEWRTVFYFAFFSTLGGATLVILGGGWHPVSWHTVWPLIGVGVTGTIAQLTLTRAYKTGNKFLVASLSYLTVVFSTLLGYLLWGDPLSVANLFAMVLIIISGILAGRR